MYGAEHSIFFDRTFLITAAAEGLGPELAQGLVARGASVLAVDRDPSALAALRRDLGPTFTPLARDLADPAAPVEIARWIADDHPRLAGLICNAAGRPGTEPGAALRQVFGPAALAGLLWPVLHGPDRGRLALLLPPGTLATGFGRLAAAPRARAWNAGRRSGVTTATVTAGALAGGTAARREAADRILDAIDRGRPHLRVGARWGAAASAWQMSGADCHAGGAGRA